MELLLDSNRKMEVNISNIKLDMSRFSRKLVLLLVTIIWQSSLGTKSAQISSQNLGQNGYRKYEDGLLIQWGKVSGSSITSYAIIMPATFYDKFYKIFATVYKPSSDSSVYSASPIDDSTKTVSRFYINRNYASGGTTGLSQETFDWMAIGRWK
jgi:hypothetical protein